MLKLKSKQIGLLLVDISIAFLALYGALGLRFLDLPYEDRIITHLYLFVPLVLIQILVYYSFDFYDFSPFRSKFGQFSKVINIHLFIAFVGLGYFYLFANYVGITPKTVLALYTIVHIFLAVGWRVLLAPNLFTPSARARTLLIAEGGEYDELKSVVNSHAYFPFYFVDHLIVQAKDLESHESTLNKLRVSLEQNNIDQVVIDIRDDRVTQLLPYLYTLASQRKIHVFDASMVYQDVLRKMSMRWVGHFWFFESVHMNVQAYEAAKRVIDIALALPWIIFWGILHPFVYIAIKLNSKGDVFIAQERFGLGGKIITLYKYRTMTFSDKGKWLKDKDNTNKVTSVGYWLRKSRIDELPQLLAILKGDISFIGPRPDILALGGNLSAEIPFYMMRYTVRPGLSGWAQVNQALPPQSIEETKIRLQYDLYYVQNRSLLLDFVIMVKTFKVLVLRSGM
jgi:lipopolysaccharide/colanic/teichoic acid biosynthesis glycosyltransferase